MLLATIKSAGFSPSPTNGLVEEGPVIAVVFQEGYILARIWKDDRYCALDINIWERYQDVTKLQELLTNNFGTDNDISSFRVIVGGMFGSKTWKEQKEWMGPQFVQMRDCNIDSVDDSSKVDEI